MLMPMTGMSGALDMDLNSRGPARQDSSWITTEPWRFFFSRFRVGSTANFNRRVAGIEDLEEQFDVVIGE